MPGASWKTIHHSLVQKIELCASTQNPMAATVAENQWMVLENSEANQSPEQA